MAEVTTYKQARRILFSFLIRGSVVAGFMLAPDSPMYGNWIRILQWWFWVSFALFAFVAVALIVDGIKAPSFIAGDKRIGSLRSMHLIRSSWASRFCLWAINIPSLLFVGVVMGRWGLFVPMLLADAAAKMSVYFGAQAWDSIPEAVRNPTPEAKAKEEAELKAIATGPVTRAVDAARKRAADEKKAQDEMADKIIDQE